MKKTATTKITVTSEGKTLFNSFRINKGNTGDH